MDVTDSDTYNSFCNDTLPTLVNKTALLLSATFEAASVPLDFLFREQR